MAVTDMASTTAPSQLGSQFNDFLFASVGEDGNENFLSVLSALARLDIDPWEEAAALARLTRESAIERLTSIIANTQRFEWRVAGIVAQYKNSEDVISGHRASDRSRRPKHNGQKSSPKQCAINVGCFHPLYCIHPA
jgi:hypothetical protein